MMNNPELFPISAYEQRWHMVEVLLDANAVAAHSADGFMAHIGPAVACELAKSPDARTLDRSSFWLGPTPEGREAVLRDDSLACLVSAGARNTCLVARRNATCIDTNRSISELTTADMVHLSCLLQRSQAGSLQLLRYHLGTLYADPWMDSSKAWHAYEGILRELRSPVWDWHDGTVASLPWYKFHNPGESPETTLKKLLATARDAAFVEGTEKLDGTFVQLRALPDGRVVLSTSHFLHGAPQTEGIEPLATIARSILAKDGPYLKMARSHPEATLMLELVDPDVERLVIDYPPERRGLWLVGGRDVRTGRLWRHAELVEAVAGTAVRVSPLICATLADAVRLAITDDQFEGTVLSFGGALVKVKSISYLTSLKAREGSFENVAFAWAGDYLDDLTSSLSPADAARAIATGTRLSAFVESCEEALVLLRAEMPRDSDSDPSDWLASHQVPGFLLPWLFADIESPYQLALVEPGSTRFVDEDELARREDQLRDWRLRL